MPLVFVHGVNVRQGETQQEKANFQKSVDARDNFFRTIGIAGLVPPPTRLHIENPYWGEHAAKFAYDLASIPAASTETFGPTDDLMAQVLAETVPFDVAAELEEKPGGETAILLTLARKHSLAHAIDTVVAAATVRGAAADGNVDAQQREEMAQFAAEALAFAAANPDTSWLDATHPVTGQPRFQTDIDFLEGLAERVQAARAARADAGVETFGIAGMLDLLKGAAQNMTDVAKRTFKAVVTATAGTLVGATGGAVIGGAPEVLVRTLRPLATQRAGIFLGDIFTYLAGRGTKQAPGPIVEVVIAALENAVAQKTAQDDKLTIVAHSMGGNIIYDVLTHYRPDIHVDLLVTVGSQVALFKELSLYQEDADGNQDIVPPALIPKPENVGAWLNVFDPMDVLGFGIEGVFKDAKDFAFSNQASLLDAHSLYFVRPTFHQRLRARMAELGFGGAL
jgi:tellurite resistance protein